MESSWRSPHVSMATKRTLQKLGTRLSAIALFCLLFCTVSWAAEWILVHTIKGQDAAVATKFDTFYYLNTKTISAVSSTKVRFWYVIESLPTGSTEPNQDEISRKGFKSYIELDCARKRYRSVEREMEAPPGYVVATPVYWENIEPGSAYEKMAEAVCKKRRAK